jgi:hypothetical protein
MFPPALLVKTESPFSELIRFKALSDEDMQMANDRFLRRGEPYKIIRELAEAAA